MTPVQEFDFSVDLLQAMLWQDDDAARLRSLIEQKQAWVDANQRDFWERWLADVFDLTTATDFGLAVWAQILAVPLYVGVEGSGSRPVFGFGANNRNFFDGTFGRNNSGVIGLTLEQKRLLLRLRYFQLTSSANVTEINQQLAILFGGEGLVFVTDGLNMEAIYLFTFSPSADVLFVLENYDLLPRPAGVKVSILISPENNFGFAPFYKNFENGNFSKA